MTRPFHDRQAMTLVAPVLYPGEQVLFRARGAQKPWYAVWLGGLGKPFWKYWLVIATNQRIVFVQHAHVREEAQRSGGEYVTVGTDAFAWDEVDDIELDARLLGMTLRVRVECKNISRRVFVPRGWMRGNIHAAYGIADTWRKSRSTSTPPPPWVRTARDQEPESGKEDALHRPPSIART